MPFFLAKAMFTQTNIRHQTDRHTINSTNSIH